MSVSRSDQQSARRLPSPSRVVSATSAALGIVAALYFARAGLTLSHYDARGHLIVARRIFDSVTPGWQQIGAVWLPLPHLLNALPVQMDVLYRTGWSGVAISIASFVMAVTALAWLVHIATDSRVASMAAAAIFALNPNLLYLQSTPMTEPLLIALLTAAVALLFRDLLRTTPASVWRIGGLFALACLTRYEAWPVTMAAIGAAVWASLRRGMPATGAVRIGLRLALLPFLAIVSFLVFSRAVVGEWFVSGGFFVPEPRSLGHPVVVAGDMLWGLRELAGRTVLAVGVAGVCFALVRSVFRRTAAAGLVALSLAATAAVPFMAFVDGHPYRIRYMAPLIAVLAFGCGYLLAALGRARAMAAAALVALAVFECPPLQSRAAMVEEAKWDVPNIARRQPMTDYLRSRYRGETIMASMGSLGHYMQELSDAGLQVHDFLHEGNGDVWLRAIDGHPERFAGWMLIDEQGEGGDMLSKIARENPRFLDGFSRVREAAGIALYERQNRTLNVAR